MRIGDLAYSHEMLDLGMLKGNKFTITLRYVRVASETTTNRNILTHRSVETDREQEIEEILASLRDHGFINFYGKLLR